MSISICMATYNGELYLRPQIASIVEQMGPDDELIVIDDASTDGTIAYLKSLQDPRIRLTRNEKNLGHVQSFAKAIGLASRQLIFMSDQDDIWVAGRVRTMYDTLSAGAALVSTNSGYISADGQPIPPLQPGLNRCESGRHWRNIWRIFNGTAAYYGCAMALRDELRDIILPIPSYVESHDLWIAMAANMAGNNQHLDRITLLRRVHGTNASVISRPILKKLWSRVIFARSFMQIALRIIFKGSRLRAIQIQKIHNNVSGAV
jgi:glycosyltransferase involved in cell wall biosynthesis